MSVPSPSTLSIVNKSINHLTSDRQHDRTVHLASSNLSHSLFHSGIDEAEESRGGQVALLSREHKPKDVINLKPSTSSDSNAECNIQWPQPGDLLESYVVKDLIQTLPDLEGDDLFLQSVDSFIADLNHALPDNRVLANASTGDPIFKRSANTMDQQVLPYREHSVFKELSKNDRQHLEQYLKKVDEREIQFQTDREETKRCKHRLIRTKSEEIVAKGG